MSGNEKVDRSVSQQRTVGSLMEGLAVSQLEQVRDYLKALHIEASDEAIVVMAVTQVLNLSLLDPVIKKELYDFILQLRGLVKGGGLEKKFVKRKLKSVDEEMMQRGETIGEFNERLLRELATFLMMDLSQYSKPEK